MKENDERVYVVAVDIVSTDIEELETQLESMLESIKEGITYKKEKLSGDTKGQWMVNNFIRCKYCKGDGEILTDETDSDGNIMRGVGIEKCICQL